MYGATPVAQSPEGLAILEKITNDPLRDYCEETKGLVPAFEDFSNHSFNEHIWKSVQDLNKLDLEPGSVIEGRPQ